MPNIKRAVPVTAEQWTVASLKDYMESVIRANDERYSQRFLDSQTAVQAALSAARTAVDAALSAAKEAVAKAEAASERRFQTVDEFQKAFGNQQRDLLPRPEAELRFSTIETRMAKYELAETMGQGQRAGSTDTKAYIIAVVGILVGLGGLIVALFLKP